METLRQEHRQCDLSSVEFAEELLTSPRLPNYGDAARSQLLHSFYTGTIDDHSMYDVISLAGSWFKDEIELWRDSSKKLSNIYDQQELADKLYRASSTVARYLGLDLNVSMENQQHMTTYGRSNIDGIANILVRIGAGTFDQY